MPTPHHRTLRLDPPTRSDDAVRPLILSDPRSRAVFDLVQQLGPSHATVLVSGETGTGKEIIARHLHAASRRSTGPFVAVNCAAFHASLVESELFGNERGAFTGASVATKGWFEAAHGGTLFLDEIGDLPLGAQVKLLRVLQEREVVRLGSRQPIAIDVRLIAASNVELEHAVAAGRFRGDLYYRLKVALITLPPLRARPGDILPLARHFLALHRQRLGGGARDFAPEAERVLLAHDWPGNVRELENVIQSALLLTSGAHIEPSVLYLSTTHPRLHCAPEDVTRELQGALLALFESGPQRLYARVEETLMRVAFQYCDRNQLQTARLLGISRNVVRARLMEIGEIPAGSRGPGRSSHNALANRTTR